QNMVNVSGTVNIPVSSIGAIRVFGFHNEDDGFVFDNDPSRINGRSNLDDSGIWPLPLVGDGTLYVPDSGNSAEAWMRYPNQKEEWGLRGSALFEFSPEFDLYATARYNELDGGNNNWRADDPRNLTYSPERDLTFAGRNVRETFGASAELTYAFPWVEASYLASYTDAESLRTTDLDVSSEVGFDLVRPETTEVNTHELRFTSQSSGPFEWIVGLYYAKIKNDWAGYANFYDTTDVLSAVISPSDTLNILDGVLGDPVFPPTFLQETTVRVPFPFENRYRERENKAVFFTTSYRLEDWEFGFGLRVDDWTADTLDRNATLYATGVPYLEQGDTEILPKASVSYFMDDGTHIYGNFSRGFEPGNFNLYDAAGTPVLNPYKKEIADNFELGIKTELFNGDVSFNAAGFYIDYTDRQFELQQQIAIGGVIENILNAGDSTQYGFEADMNWIVSDELTLRAGLGLVEAEFGDGSLVNDVNSQPSDVSGKTPPWISDYSFNLAADFTTPVNNNLDFRASFEVLGKGPYFFNQENTAEHPSYEVANLFVGIGADRWDLSLNVENLFDTGYYTDGSIWPGDAIPGAERDLVIGTLGQPRIVSVSAKVRF
ncbi:TonB-dependent receptor, partial [Hyphomonas sp.]